MQTACLVVHTFKEVHWVDYVFSAGFFVAVYINVICSLNPMITQLVLNFAFSLRNRRFSAGLFTSRTTTARHYA